MKRSRKGFTLVELLVVIAIVAILATVAIIGYTSFTKKAEESNDRTLVAQLNTAITGQDGDIHEVAEALRAHGFDIRKIKTIADEHQILWNETEKRFFYTADETPAGTNWIISDEVNPSYNTYFIGAVNGGTFTETGDVTVVIYTESGDLTINAPEAHITHYGKADSVNVVAVADSSYYENGAVESLTVADGRIVLASGAKVISLTVPESSTANVTVNNGAKVDSLILNAEVTVTGTVGAVATENEDLLAKLETLVPSAGEVIDAVVDPETLGDFAGGFGTEAAPFIIANAEQLANISKHYDTYNYYKIADGVTSLDLTGVGKIYLHGSFDGNGVSLVNLTTALFERVGYQNNVETIKISNITATMNATDGRAFVRNIYNAGTTTFENITLHGYIEGQYNMGSFYNYGTANLGGSAGADYTVEFINSKSDMTLVCTSGNGIGGMIGHGYEGAGNTLTIICDDKSVYTGNMYTTNGSTCDSLMYMASNTSNFILNGVEVSGYDASFNYPSTKLTVVKPVEGEFGYTVTPVEGATKFVVYVAPQVSAHDENGAQITNLSGMTWSFVHDEMDITGTDAVKVLDLVSSAVIVNGTDHDYGYALADGVLTIYSGKTENYASGTVRLQVNQYDANGDILAVGTIDLYKIPAPEVAE